MNQELSQQEFVENLRIRMMSRTELRIWNVNKHKLRLHGLALQNSKDHITSLTISGEDGKLTDAYDAEDAALFLHFVRTCATLREIDCSFIRSEGLVRMLFQAVASNPSIECVTLSRIPSIFAMVGMLLQESSKTALKELRIDGQYVKWTAESEVDLPAAFQQSKNLKNLHLENLDWSKLEQAQCHLTPLRVFVESIKRSTSVTTIHFTGCSFNASATLDLLELGCYQNQSNLQELHIGRSNVFVTDDKGSRLSNRAHQTIFCMKMIRSKVHGSTLKKLKVEASDVYVQGLLLPFEEYGCFLTKSLFVSIEINNMSCFHFKQVLSSLPQLRGLDELVLRPNVNMTANTMETVEDSMRKTHFLKRLQIMNPAGETIMNDTWIMLCKRNESIRNWRDGTDYQRSKKCLPRILAACLQYELKMEIIFDVLKRPWSLPNI